MRLLCLSMLSLCWLVTAPVSAQAPSPFPFDQAPVTYADVFRVVTRDAFYQVQRHLGPQRFRLSLQTGSGTDGLERVLQESISVSADSPAALNAAWRQTLAAKTLNLATRLKAYKVVGSLPIPQHRTAQTESQTPDALTITSVPQGLHMQTTYTRGTFGSHNLYLRVEVGP